MFTKIHVLVHNIFVNDKQDLNRKQLTAKSKWRGQHRVSKCLIFIVVSCKVKSRGLKYTQPKVYKLKREPTFVKNLCLRFTFIRRRRSDTSNEKSKT